MNGGRRQPYCGNTTNVNLCSHIWSICYLAQSIFESNEIIAEPCNRKCPSGVNLNQKPTRRTSRNRYGFALNYGIPMGQSTPKKYVLEFLITKLFNIKKCTVVLLILLFFLVLLVRSVLKTRHHRSVQQHQVLQWEIHAVVFRHQNGQRYFKTFILTIIKQS